MKKAKGQYGYMKSQKLIRTLRTAAFFALVAAVFMIGLFLNKGDRKNIYTVIAMVGCIPASMSLVSMIMVWLRRSTDPELYRETTEAAGSMPVCYELFLTTKDKNLYLDAAAVSDDCIAAFTMDRVSDQDLHFMEEHIRKTLRAQGYKNMTVKIFNDRGHFLNRIAGMSKAWPGLTERQDKMADVLKAISL
ncbi:MAG: hypothetical protein U0L49_03120 [Eubacterium sp.]|nr:hypothetical protein [Eubacterium sp.]